MFHIFWTPVHIFVEASGQLVVLLGGGLLVLRGHISYPATLISRPDMKGSPLVGARQERGGRGHQLWKGGCLPVSLPLFWSHLIPQYKTSLGGGGGWWYACRVLCSVFKVSVLWNAVPYAIWDWGGGIWTIWIYASFTILHCFVHQTVSYFSLYRVVLYTDIFTWKCTIHLTKCESVHCLPLLLLVHIVQYSVSDTTVLLCCIVLCVKGGRRGGPRSNFWKSCTQSCKHHVIPGGSIKVLALESKFVLKFQRWLYMTKKKMGI